MPYCLACGGGVSKLLPAPVTLACIAVFPQEPALPRTCTRLTLRLPRPLRRGVSAKIVDVNCGTYATFATTADGHVFTFGLNNYGQLALPGARGQGTVAPATARECMHVAQRLLAPLQPLSRPERTRLSRFLLLPEPCPSLFLLNRASPFPLSPLPGLALVYAPTLVKALQGKDVALIRSGQHHTLALTHAGEMRSGAGLGCVGSAAAGAPAGLGCSWVGCSWVSCSNRSARHAHGGALPAADGRHPWTRHARWHRQQAAFGGPPTWLAPPLQARCCRLAAPRMAGWARKMLMWRLMQVGPCCTFLACLCLAPPAARGLQPAHADLQDLTCCAYSHARAHRASASVRWVSSEHVRPPRFAPMHSLPRAQGSGRPGGRQGRGRSGRACGIR